MATLGNNVGIATTSPSAKLHVVGAVQNASIQDYGIAAFENSNSEGLSIGYDADGGYTYLYSREFGVSSRALHLNGSVYVNYSGNVGLGTTSPGAKLVVNSGTTNTVTIFSSSDDKAFIRIKDDDRYLLNFSRK